MPRLRLHAAAVLAIGLAGLSSASLAGPAGDIRKKAATWLEAYDRTLASLVATETYTQCVYRRNTVGENTVTRVLRSEFAWVPVLGGRDLLGVRDVREIDGQPVGGASRLDELLRAPAADRDWMVRALLGESIRLLEVPTAVNFNFPTFVLGYLRADDAERARWSVKGGSAPGTLTLRFRETDRSRVRTPEGRRVKAEGWLLVDTSSGQVREASVTLNDAHAVDEPTPGTESVRYEARVRFADDARVNAWVPTEMEDRYEWRRRSSEAGRVTDALFIEGRSTYEEYRRYGTDVRIVPR